MAVAASDDSHLLGKFWLAESPDHQLTGWLDLSGSRPVVTVNGQLTPAMTSRAQNEDWDASEFADKEFDSVTHTIHGHLAEGRKRKVTIAEAVSASRRYNMILDVDPEGEPSGGVHVFRGAWAARGAHISVDETIGSASIRFANIDEWVRSNGVTVEIVPGDPRRKVRISYEQPEADSAPIPGSGGRIATKFLRHHPEVRFDGAGVRQDAWLAFDDVECASLDELLRVMVSPVLTLVSVMLDRKVGLTELEVLTEKTDDYLTVYHPMVTRNAAAVPIEPGYFFIGLPNVSLSNLATWISMAHIYAPVPNILYSALDLHPTGTLESRLLQLAACAEGLVRRQFADKRIVEKAVAKKARNAARNAVEEAVGDEVAERVAQALAHFGDITYAERLNLLLDFTQDVVPEAAGDRSAWIKKVKNARNGFAHLLEGSTDSWEVSFVLLESLKWILGAALLLNAGISANAIKERLAAYEGYSFFKRQASALAHEVYGS